MKKRFKALLALVMSLTMVFGMSTTTFAADNYPPNVACGGAGDDEHMAAGSHLYIVGTYTVYNGYLGHDVTYFAFYLYDDYGDYAYRGYNLGPDEYNCQSISVDYCDESEWQGHIPGWFYEDRNGRIHRCPSNDPTPGPEPEKPSSSAHVHNFTWQTITEPTKDSDGLEGEVCSCGATRNTQPLSAFGFILNDYAPSLIKAAKPGQTVTFEFGEWNSFPKSFMAKLVDKSAQNVTFVFHYNWNHVKQEIIIPAGTPIDLNFDWYGPAKMAELYGANKQ